MGYRVAVVGATGNVGREIMQILTERNFPADEVVALASERSVGTEVSYGDTAVLKVRNLADFDFAGIDLVMSSPGASVSKVHSPRAAAAGAVVIDNTSFFRMDPDVDPLPVWAHTSKKTSKVEKKLPYKCSTSSLPSKSCPSQRMEEKAGGEDWRRRHTQA